MTDKSNRGDISYLYKALKYGFKELGVMTTKEIQILYTDACTEDKLIPNRTTQIWKWLKFMVDRHMLKKQFVRGGMVGGCALFTKGKNFGREEILAPLCTRKLFVVNRHYIIKKRPCYGYYEISKRFCRDICTIREECEKSTKLKGGGMKR